jgi:hypothetical protein
MTLRSKIIAYFGVILLSICCSAYSGPKVWVRSSFRAEIAHEAAKTEQLRLNSLRAVSPMASILVAQPFYNTRIRSDIDIIKAMQGHILGLSEQLKVNDGLVNQARGEKLLHHAILEFLTAQDAYHDVIETIRDAERLAPRREMPEHSKQVISAGEDFRRSLGLPTAESDDSL